MNAVQHIRNQLDKEKILMLLEKYGAKQITEDGNSYRSTCPLHSGDNPTAFVWRWDNGLWYCFTGDCGGGDVFDFFANVLDLSVEHEFQEIVRHVAMELNIDIENLELGERASQWDKERLQWLKFMNMRMKKTNQEYDMRKLGNLFPIKTYRNFTEETVKRFGALYSGQFERIAIPLYNAHGLCVGASLRSTRPAPYTKDHPKWLHRPKHVNTSEIIYNLNNIPENYTSIYLVEGAFDVWNLVQMGVENVGGTLGSHLTEEQMYLILARFTDVYLLYDSDKAG
jgi:DNA primase